MFCSKPLLPGPVHQELIFRDLCFHQGDKSHRASGSGLGLAIAREIMTRLGARLTVHSELGEGSEFSFTLRQENQA